MSVSQAQRPPARPRPLPIRALRIALPAVAVSLALLVIGWSASGLFRRAPHDASTAQIELTSPRLMGEDSRQRPYVITAAKAVRDSASAQRVKLDHLVLVRSPGTPDELRVAAPVGLYDEASGRLQLSGGVDIVQARGHVTTPATVYDTKAGTLLGGEVQAEGDLGRFHAGSVSTKDNGRTVVYRGGVHARINPR
jgi:lipopolysaccharide export system protein LptC